MARDLPSLESLRVFEAAARHLSFTRAADELCVTQGAVSQRIKNLEDHLGIALFKRGSGRLLLTDAGQDLARDVADALAGLTQSLRRLRDRDRGGPLTVTMMPSFAASFLIARLGRFLTARPDIDLRLHTSFEVVDFARDGIDAAIRHGPGRYPGLHVEPLAQEQVFPVCAPCWAEKLKSPADLLNAPLIRDHDVSWELWLRAAGLSGATPAGPSFLDTHLALQTAAAGQGVTLGRTLVAADDLRLGRLVRPFALSAPAPHAYWLVCPPERAADPRITAFADWLKAEIDETMTQITEAAPINPDSAPPNGP